ncbi:MAG: HNH endonuclease [Clostridia bacterium]|nr:HNH endonuclease [Clostridia bacterium]
MSSGKKRYTQELYEFVKENVAGRTSKELAAMVSEHFGIEMTESRIKAYKSNYKLKSGTPKGTPKGQASALYPQPVIDFIKANYKGTGHQKMAELVNEKFGTVYTKEQIKSFYHNRHLNSGLTGRFEKGHIPANKGTHPPTVGRMSETQFKKGHLPHNTKPIGYERISKDGYIEVKVKMRPSGPDCNDNFVSKHRLVWEQTYGPIPEGQKIMFLDGDKLNCDITNLTLVSEEELLEVNRQKLICKNADLTQTGLLIAKACIAGRKRKKVLKQKKEP